MAHSALFHCKMQVYFPSTPMFNLENESYFKIPEFHRH